MADPYQELLDWIKKQRGGGTQPTQSWGQTSGWQPEPPTGYATYAEALAALPSPEYEVIPTKEGRWWYQQKTRRGITPEAPEELALAQKNYDLAKDNYYESVRQFNALLEQNDRRIAQGMIITPEQRERLDIAKDQVAETKRQFDLTYGIQLTRLEREGKLTPYERERLDLDKRQADEVTRQFNLQFEFQQRGGAEGIYTPEEQEKMAEHKRQFEVTQAWLQEQAGTEATWRQQQLAAQKEQQQQQIAWQREQQTAQLGAEKEARLAQLRANPASWLEYASLAGQTPVVQPWMTPLGTPQPLPPGVTSQPGEQWGAGQPLPGYTGLPKAKTYISTPEGDWYTPVDVDPQTGRQTPSGPPVPREEYLKLTYGAQDTSLRSLPALTTPSAQYQARMGPTATQQYGGYERARTGAPLEETQWRLWAGAPPTGRYTGARRR